MRECANRGTNHSVTVMATASRNPALPAFRELQESALERLTKLKTDYVNRINDDFFQAQILHREAELHRCNKFQLFDCLEGSAVKGF